MKLKVKQVRDINEALKIAGQGKHSFRVNYGIGKNQRIIKPFIEDYSEDEKLRVKTYAKHDEKGNLVLLNKTVANGVESGTYDFEDRKKEADEKYKEINDKEVDVEFYKFKLADDDKIEGNILAYLLDLIEE